MLLAGHSGTSVHIYDQKATATHIIVNGLYCPEVNGHVMGRQTQQWTVQTVQGPCNSDGCGCED